MLLEGWTVKEAISFGINLLGFAKNGYDALTGNTVTAKLSKIEKRLEGLTRVGDHLALSTMREVSARDGATRSIHDLNSLTAAMQRVQTAMGADLIQSQPIKAPQPLMRVFGENPENLLEGVQPLNSPDLDRSLMDNPTYVPMVFERWGVQLIGWVKKGAVEISLGTIYNPLIGDRISETEKVRVTPKLIIDPKPKGGDALTVGPGGFSSLADAVISARAGQRIEVMPARFKSARHLISSGSAIAGTLFSRLKMTA